MVEYAPCKVYEVNILCGRLKPLDIEIMKRLGTRVNLIPVIAKADTLTQNDLFTFKQRVRIRISFVLLHFVSTTPADSRRYQCAGHQDLPAPH